MKLSDGHPAYPSPTPPPRAAPQSRVHEGWNSVISSWHGKQRRRDLKTSSAPEQKTSQASLSTLNPTQPTPSLRPGSPTQVTFVGGPTRAVSLPLLRSRPLVAMPAGTTGPPENRAEPLPSTAWGAGTFPDPAKKLILEVGFAGVGCLGLAGAAVVLCKQTLLSTEMLNSKEHLRPTITPIYPKNTDDMHGARTLPCPRVPYGPGFPPTPAIQLLDP